MTNKNLRESELQEIFQNWFACLYDMEEDGTEDVSLLLALLGNKSLKVLEAACGSGRILIPAAKAGHAAHGFDLDETLLSRIPDKAEGLTNITYESMDAFTGDWGDDYDAVILGGNLLINIESDMPYNKAQQLLIQKAAGCLKPGGHIFMDFSLYAHPENVFSRDKGRVIFEGTDNRGISGKYIVIGDSYDTAARMAVGRRRIELIMPDGSREVLNQTFLKYIPTLTDVHKWLDTAGFVLESEYGNYHREPVTEHTERCLIYARKTA